MPREPCGRVKLYMSGVEALIPSERRVAESAGRHRSIGADDLLAGADFTDAATSAANALR